MYPIRLGQSQSAGPGGVGYHERRSQGSVEDGLIRHRIALLPFDEADDLSTAAQDLVMNGFSASQFCVLGQHDKLLVIDGAPGESVAAPGMLADLWLDPAHEIKFKGLGHIGIRCGDAAAVLFGDAGRQYEQPDWMKPELVGTIARSIERGRLILLVAAHSATQHALGARLLLRHGNHDLQTHEFSVRDLS